MSEDTKPAEKPKRSWYQYGAVALVSLLLVAADKNEGKPKSAADYIKRGDSFYKDGKFDKAIDDYTEALSDVEQLKVQALSIVDLCDLYLAVRRDRISSKNIIEQSLKTIDTQIEKSDSTSLPKIFHNKNAGQRLKVINSELGKLNHLISWFAKRERQLREPLKQSAEAYNKRGNSWKEKGNKDKADADYKKAKDLDLIRKRAFKQSAANSPTSKQIQSWVKELGDDEFKVREEATRNLIEAGEVAFEEVRKAVKSKDAEVKQRASKIIKQLTLIRTSSADIIKCR